MPNTNVSTLIALLVALGTGLAEANVADESQPVPLCSRATTSQSWDTDPPSEQEGSSPHSSPPPAAKAVAQAANCPSVDAAALTGDTLLNYLRTTSRDCLLNNFLTHSNPSIKAHLPTIFSNRNMQSVLTEIEESAAVYDGTNSTGMLQLWLFVQHGYSSHRWFSAWTGVGPFNATTDRALFAASDAFAASDHFYAPNDEAAQILYYYFEAAFTAGLRQNHLAPIKQVLSRFTPERATSESEICIDHGDGTQGCSIWAPQRWALETVLRRVNGAFENHDEGLFLHRDFMDALAQDPEFVEIILQITRYDFFFVFEESDPFMFTYWQRQIEQAIKILVRLAQLDSQREAAVTALISVLSEHDPLSSPSLTVIRALENQVDCASLNICRDDLEREILAQAVPNTYLFDDGAIVFQTSLTLEKVQPWYYAIKQVQAQFHRLVETDEIVRDDRDVFTARIYGTKDDYTRFEAYLSGADTRGIYSSGLYSSGIMRTWVRNQPGDRVTYSGSSFEELFRHEYAHYLADRFGLLSFGGPWFDEGLAEFLAGSTQAQGVLVRAEPVQYITRNDAFRLNPNELFKSGYSNEWGGEVFYYYAGFFFHFMHQEQRTRLLELFGLLRSGDYHARTRSWAADRQLAADFNAFLDEQIANVSRAYEPPLSTYTPYLPSLTSDSIEKIEEALERIDGDLNLDCLTVFTEPIPRFGCSGILPAGAEFSGDRGALNEHLNTRLDGFITAAVEDGGINNFKAMNCYFTNVVGSPPVADLYCEGPLQSADVASIQSHPPEQETTTDGQSTSQTLAAVSGDGQEGPASTQLDESFVISVLDQDGSPLAGVNVTFAVTAGGGMLSATTDTNPCIFKLSTSSLTATTDANGQAATRLTLGSEPGTNSVEATIEGLEPVSFTATAAEQATPHRLTKVCGDDQEGTAGERLAQPLVVSVLDEDGAAMAGVDVSFTVTAGGGTLSAATATTNANGRARTYLTLGSELGTNTVSATVAGLEPVIFTATGQEPPISLFDIFLGSGKLVALPDSPQLAQNAPNPFNSQTILAYFLHAPGPARVEVFALSGQRVAVLHQGQQQAGYHRLRWDGRDDAGRSVASGMYLYRLVTDEGVLTRKLILLR